MAKNSFIITIATFGLIYYYLSKSPVSLSRAEETYVFVDKKYFEVKYKSLSYIHLDNSLLS